ncbi:MAG: tetratricopeptide repeat protein [Myxococcales bacterium]|nr:tetratricopeptide repeat protein [Myxococcales bacterium]
MLAAIALLALPLVQPRPEVQALHRQGEAALAADQPGEAARYFRAALALQPSNLSWLGLGEALSRQGACAEAADALAEVAAAPETPESPAAFAEPLAAGLRRSLEDRCPGRLLVRCAGPLGRFLLDDDQDLPCGHAVDVPAGAHRVRLAAGLAEISMQIRGLQQSEVTLAEPVAPDLGPAPAPAPEPEPAASPLPWALVGSGGAVLAAAVILHLGPTQAARDDAEAARADYAAGLGSASRALDRSDAFEGWRRGTLGAYVGGALLAAAGATLLVIDWP